jgi:hypothetical protein
MCVSWKTAAGLFILALAGGGGCAAGSAETASDGETLAAPEADDAQVAPGDVDVTVNVNENGSNDTGHSCGHHHHHHHGGGAQGSPGDNAQPPPGPATPPPGPAVPPPGPAAPPAPSAPPSAPDQPGAG